jgi:pyruvate,water dikinase
VAEFGLAVEQVCGRPQEIEWAIAEGQFWLLQSRPITGLPEKMVIAPHFPVAWQGEAERRHAWRLTEYCEGPEPPLPLEHDFMGLQESIREETCRYLGADRHEAWRFWNGRAYWRRIPLGITPADRQIRRQAFEDLHERLQAVGWTSWDYWGPELERMVERLRAFDREMADGLTLADQLAQAQAVVRYCMAIHPRILFRPREAFFAAFSAVSGLEGQEAETAAYQLLDNEESKLTRLVDRLYELAQVAQGEAAIAEVIRAMPDEVMARLSALPEAAEFRAKLADLLAEYGERMGHGYGSEMTVLTPTWHEEPERVLYLVRAYLAVDEAPAAVRARLRREREEQVAALCAAHGEEGATSASSVQAWAEFQRQLAYARRSMAGLEDHNHLIEQVAGGQLRLAIMAAARWLVKQGVLAAADDVFWLRFGEIEEVLRGEERRAKSEGRRARREEARFWREAIVGRQAEWEQWAELMHPPILGMPEATLPVRPPLVDEVNMGEDGEENGRLVGLGASPGRAEGPALVMLKGYLPPEMEPGTILVAQNAGPLWTPYFPQLGGLVLEEGSLGQHAAATAREYGIPAVVGCRQAMRLIADDDWIRLDGTTGVVEVIR